MMIISAAAGLDDGRQDAGEQRAFISGLENADKDQDRDDRKVLEEQDREARASDRRREPLLTARSSMTIAVEERQSAAPMTRAVTGGWPSS